MVLRQLALVVPLAALVCISGCRSTSNRVSYSTQPAVVAAVPAPPPCAVPAAPCPAAGVVPPPPPPGFVR
jgi:hypothetical protein